MKRILLIFGTICFACLALKAQKTNMLILNASPAQIADTVDIAGKIKGAESTFIEISQLEKHDATEPFEIPADTNLKFFIYEHGTSSEITTIELGKNDVAKDQMKFYEYRQIGTYISQSFNTNIYLDSGISIPEDNENFKYCLHQHVSGTGFLDLHSSVSGNKLIANIIETRFKCSGPDKAQQDTLYFTPSGEQEKLFAYEFPGDTLGGQYLYFYTAGDSSTLDLYLTEMDGTVTKLADVNPEKVTSIASHESGGNITLHPNPVRDQLHIKKKGPLNGTVIIRDLTGRIILKQKLQHTINVASLAEDIYTVTIKSGTKTYTKRIIKQP